MMAKRSSAPSDGAIKAARGTQYYSSFCASMGGFAAGAVIGYTSPATYQLREYKNSSIITVGAHHPQHIVSDNESFISHEEAIDEISSQEHRGGAIFDDTFTLSSEQIAWVSSAFSIGAFVGGLISILLMQKLGRRGTMVATGVPSLLGWLLIGFGINFPMIMVGRILTGIFSGIICVAVNTYIAEITSSDIRGTLGGAFHLQVANGVVYGYITGSYLAWYYLAFVCLVPSVLFVVLMYFNKESPSHLIGIGKEEEAMAALEYFRGRQYDITEEFCSLKKAYYEASREKLSFSDILQPAVYKPFVIVLPLMMLMQLCGINAIVFNASTIFQSANSSLSANASSVLSATLLVISSIPAVLLVDVAGRRMLLIISAAGMTFSMGFLGLFFYYFEYYEEWTTSNLAWLPLVAVVIFFISFPLGFGTIPWIMMGEMFPPNVRETATSISTALNWATSFFVIYSFETVQVALHSYGYYWLFTGFCALAMLFSAVCVKETKGKTLHEITDMFASTDRH